MNQPRCSLAPPASIDADATDGELLSSFVEHRDEAAFESLVGRHGPMVWSVCRRVLRNDHDAQDAFQATFLVLVRKAASIKPRGMIANWLYGVARRAAMKTGAMSMKRSAREKQLESVAIAKAPDKDLWSDLLAVLDQELYRLPDKYRVPIVLCDLEGKSQKEAARQLGWPQGTVSGRLSRGRAILARRLSRCGLTVGAAALVDVLSQHAALSAVPTLLVSSTVKVTSLAALGPTAATGAISTKVIAITEGVLKAMLLTKLKIATMSLLGLVLLGAGAGLLHHESQAADPPAKAKAQRDEEAIQGTWRAVDIQEAHQPRPTPEQWALLSKLKIVITADTITFGERGMRSKYKLDPTTTPKRMIGLSDFDRGIAIYELNGDRMKFCTGGGKTPDSFNVENLPVGTRRTCWTLRREK
jgi:RNA polymerase sigma factor (sigma-70 family)